MARKTVSCQSPSVPKPDRTSSYERVNSVAILGTGSFGSAIAKLLSCKVSDILLIGRDQETVDAINQEHRNPRYLHGISFPTHVRASTSFADAADFPVIIFAVPTSATRGVAEQIAGILKNDKAILVSCAKGIERSTGERMSEILHEVLPNQPLAVLSGPNHAEEFAVGLPTCAVIGSEDPALAKQLQELFTFPTFRTYTSDDVAGMELGGAIKNVYAIASGIAQGLGLGDNAVAALVTRALAEMTRLGTKLGGRPETFNGLSGVGDLVVTCYSHHSRNHRVGKALGGGQTLEEAVNSLGMVAEGVPNTLSIYEAARRVGVRTPLIDAMHAILYQGKPASSALRDLLERDPRPEVE